MRYTPTHLSRLSNILGVAKITVLVGWSTTPVSLVLLEAVPRPSCCLTSIVDKTQFRPVIVSFFVQLLQLV